MSVVWKLFDTMFLGGLQAFIFALLTVLYFGMAGGHAEHDEHDEHDEPQHRADLERTRTRTRALSHPGPSRTRGNPSTGTRCPTKERN